MWRAAADPGGPSTPVCLSIHTHLSSSGNKAVPAQDGVWVMKEGNGASATPFDTKNQNQKPQLHHRFPPTHFRKSLYTEVNKHTIWTWTCRGLYFPSETGSIINLLLASFTYEVLWVRCLNFTTWHDMTWHDRLLKAEDQKTSGNKEYCVGLLHLARLGSGVPTVVKDYLICPGFSHFETLWLEYGLWIRINLAGWERREKASTWCFLCIKASYGLLKKKF